MTTTDRFTQVFHEQVREQGSELARELLDLSDALIAAHWGGAGIRLPRVVVMLAATSSPRSLADHCRRDEHGIHFRIRLSPRVLRMATRTNAARDRNRYLADVLLHELVHVECTDAGHDEPGYKGHGPEFAAACNRIGLRLGLPAVAARPRGKKDTGAAPAADCAHWPINVRPQGYYGALEGVARPSKQSDDEPEPEPTPIPDPADGTDEPEERSGSLRPELVALELVLVEGLVSTVQRALAIAARGVKDAQLAAELQALRAITDAIRMELR